MTPGTSIRLDDFDLPRDLPNFDQKIVRFAEKLSGLLDRRAVAIAREHLGSTGPIEEATKGKIHFSCQSACKVDPLSACKVNPLTRWLGRPEAMRGALA